jgi:hypothetical protein
MTRVSAIDLVALTALWAQGVPTDEICRRLGFGRSAVLTQVRLLGLPPREARYAKTRATKLANRQAREAAEAAAELAEQAEFCPPVRRPVSDRQISEVDLAVLQTGGRYAALMAVAQANKISTPKALQIWHQVRR